MALRAILLPQCLRATETMGLLPSLGPALWAAALPASRASGGNCTWRCALVHAPEAAHGLHTSTPALNANSGNEDKGSASSSSHAPAGPVGRRSRRSKGPPRDPLTGYPLSAAPTGGATSSSSASISSSSSASSDHPPEQLRVRLRDDGVEASAAGTTASSSSAAPDLFALSRTLVADDSSGAGAKAGADGSEQLGGEAGRQPLGPEDQRTLSKLVGCLTKEGKRSRAQRVLDDALGIISAQLRKGAAKATGSKGG